MNWVWEPSIIIGLLAITCWYEVSIGPIHRRLGWGKPTPLMRRLAFHTGTFWVFIALASPLDSLSDTSLFSAHMIQHMLLTYVGPLLWVWGTPGWLVGKLLPILPIRRAFLWITRPLPAFLIFSGVMWLWHIPVMYSAALQSQGLHVLEHVLFMGAALIGWYPVFGQYGKRPDLPIIIIYLAISMVSCTALAAIITLSPRLLYTVYGVAPYQYGMSPFVDQQIGGAIMWLPGDMIYMSLIATVFYRWLDNTTYNTQLERTHS